MVSTCGAACGRMLAKKHRPGHSRSDLPSRGTAIRPSISQSMLTWPLPVEHPIASFHQACRLWHRPLPFHHIPHETLERYDEHAPPAAPPWQRLQPPPAMRRQRPPPALLAGETAKATRPFLCPCGQWSAGMRYQGFVKSVNPRSSDTPLTIEQVPARERGLQMPPQWALWKQTCRFCEHQSRRVRHRPPIAADRCRSSSTQSLHNSAVHSCRRSVLDPCAATRLCQNLRTTILPLCAL